MKRMVKSYPIPLWIMVALVVGLSIGFAGWSNEARNHKQDAERLAGIATGSMAAVAISMQGRQYEAEKAGDLKAQVDTANERLAPMQLQINDLQEDVQRLRTNWTSELGIKP